MPKCKAKAKSTGKQCTRDAMHGMAVCYVHGGPSKKGAEHPNYKHGRRSKYMPESLREIYEGVETDTTHKAIERNLALNEAFIRGKLLTLEYGGNPAEAWAQVTKAVEDLRYAIGSLNMPLMELAATKIENICEEQNRYMQQVSEIQKTMAEQRKDLTAKSQIEHRASNAIGATELMSLIAAIVHVINRVVTERDKRVAIADGIGDIIKIPGLAHTTGAATPDA